MINRMPLPMLLIIVVVIVVVVLFVFLSLPPAEKLPECGDNICDSTETCSSCSSDCGACPAPVPLPEPQKNLSNILDLLPLKDCGNLTDGQAWANSIETRENYCGCIKDNLTKIKCRDSLQDNLYYMKAVDSFDPLVCENIVNPELKQGCIAIASSGEAYVTEKGHDWTLIYEYRNNHNFEKLLPLLEIKLSEAPEDMEILAMAADSYIAYGWEQTDNTASVARATEAINKMLSINANSLDALVLKGHLYELTHNVTESIDAYNKALEIDPKSIPALIGRGHATRVLGDVFTAIDDFKSAEALDVNKTYPDIYRNLCTLTSNDDDMLAEAVTYCKTLIGMVSESDGALLASAHDSLGNIYKRLGRNEEALSEFQEALANLPGDGLTYSYIAAVYNSEGNYVKAEESARSGLFTEPNLAYANYQLAYALFFQNKLDEAETYALKALKLTEGGDLTLLVSVSSALKVQIYALLADIYMNKGDTANEDKYVQLLETAMGESL